MKTPLKQLLCLPCLAAIVLVSLSARAEVLVSRYNVSVDGIPAGDAVLRITFDAKRYEVAVSADVGTILESTKMQGTASGVRAGAKITPERFQLAVSGGEQGTLEVNFKGEDGPGETINTRMRGVFDPLSALLATSLKPHAPSSNPCNHVLPIFTGRARFDLKLHPKLGGQVQSEPPVVVCEADYAALPGEPFQNIGIEVVFSKVSKPAFWLVERISLPTTKGTVTIEHTGTSISDS